MTRSSLLLLVPLACVAAGRSIAAEGYDNCTGFIDSLPASITAQGTWCLRKHLYTSQASGPAISVLTDNVTVDCNDHRISGFGAGIATEAVGVNTGPSRANASVRNCRVQGFKYGVVLHGNGHLVEDSRFDGNTFVGIYLSGAGTLVRGNLVTDTGGRPAAGEAIAIRASHGSIQGNVINGVSPIASGSGLKHAIGILLTHGLVCDNRISGLVTTPQEGVATGIFLQGSAVARDNAILQTFGTNGYGIRGAGAGASICRENEIKRFELQGATDCFAFENDDP